MNDILKKFTAINDGNSATYQGAKPTLQQDGTWRSSHCKPYGTHKSFRSMTFHHVGGQVRTVPLGNGQSQERPVYDVHPASKLTVMKDGPNKGKATFRGRPAGSLGKYDWIVVNAAAWLNNEEPTIEGYEIEQPPSEIVMRPAQPRPTIVNMMIPQPSAVA